MKSFLTVMKALSDPSRVKIIKLLQQKTMCVCELREALELSQPTVSRHLKILETAGLVAARKDGIWVNYTLTNGATPHATALLDHLRRHLDADPEIASLVSALSRFDRNIIRG